MNPRKSTSKKWTKLPPELISEVNSAVKELFRTELQSSEVFSEGKLYPEEILFRIGFLEKGRLKQQNFEISIDVPDEKDQAMSLLYQGVDFIQAVMQDYFADSENLDLPYSWKKISFKNNAIYFQVSTTNIQLEDMANQLLGISESEFINDLDSDEDLLSHSEVLNSEELEDLKTKKHLH